MSPIRSGASVAQGMVMCQPRKGGTCNGSWLGDADYRREKKNECRNQTSLCRVLFVNFPLIRWTLYICTPQWVDDLDKIVYLEKLKTGDIHFCVSSGDICYLPPWSNELSYIVRFCFLFVCGGYGWVVFFFNIHYKICGVAFLRGKKPHLSKCPSNILFSLAGMGR